MHGVLNMIDATEKQQDALLTSFLSKMLEATENKEEVQRAVDALDATLHEFGFHRAMEYDHRDGSARLIG